ncbi:MAG TPA: hypothetical protein VLA56_17100 [Pseudomonadales bacterium]|nr:hypothetical protein [Pseudomonadales bacterium]
MSSLVCWNCGAALDAVVQPFSRRADCPACRAELHVCAMCRWYDPKVPDQCREERAEPPTRKDVANFCEWFTPVGGLGPARRPEDEARDRLEALFGTADEAEQKGAEEGADGGAPSTEDEPVDEDPEAAARRRLDDLFR